MSPVAAAMPVMPSPMRSRVRPTASGRKPKVAISSSASPGRRAYSEQTSATISPATRRTTSASGAAPVAIISRRRVSSRRVPCMAQ